MTARIPVSGLEQVPNSLNDNPSATAHRRPQATIDDSERSSVASPPPEHKDRAVVTVLSGPGQGVVGLIGRDGVTLGRSDIADVVIPDPSLSRVHARIHCEQTDAGCVYMLEDAGSTNGTYVGTDRVEQPMRLHDGMRIGLGKRTFVRFSLQDQLEEQALLRVHESALHDKLTGVYSRSVFEDRLQTEISFTQRRKQTLALLMIDVDHFKTFNDRYGHLAGDATLQHVASVMKCHVRTEDVLARYGGEEFAVLMRDTSPEQGLVVAERIRRGIGESRLMWEGARLSVTVSVGLACVPGPAPATVKGLVQAADQALYAAKEAGRDRVASAHG